MRIVVRRIPYAQTWPLRQVVMWPEEHIDFVKIKEDPEGIHYGLFCNDDLTSVVSLFVHKTKKGDGQFRKFATVAKEQGKGYGTKLLKHVVFEAKETLKLDRLWCNARTEKAGFYEKFGLIKTDKTFVRKNKEYVIMERRFFN